MAVTKVWQDGDVFVADLRGVGWGIIFTFPVKELEQGASLSRMMNAKVRDTLNTYDGMVSKAELRQVAREGVIALRGIIEPYFEARGIGG